MIANDLGVIPSSDPLRDGLSLLASRLGRQVSVSQLGDGVALDDGRLTLDQVERAMDRAGLAARVVRMAAASAPTSLLPAVVVRRDGSTAVLVSVEGERARLLTPESGGGALEIGLDALAAEESGTMIFARPKFEADGRAGAYAQAKSRHWLKGPVRDAWPSLAEVGIAAAFANVLAVATSLFSMQVYDRVVPTSSFSTLWVLASGVGLAIGIELLLRLLRAHMLDTAGRRLDLQLSSRLFDQVMQIRFSAKPGSTGAFSSQVREFETVREFFTSSTLAALSDAPFILVFLGVIAWLGGPVAIAPAIAVVLMIVPALVMQGRLAALSRDNLREGAVKQGLLLETVDHLETVKTTRAEGRNLRLWDMLSEQLATSSIKGRSINSVLSYTASSAQQFAYVGAVIIGVYEIAAGRMTTGALVACSLLVSRAVSPTAQFTGILARWQHVKVALEGLDQLMTTPVERPAGRAFSRLSRVEGRFAVEGLEARPAPDRPPVLTLPKLEIAAGARIALIGGNGSGKTTLLRLLAGLTDPSAGRILLDGVGLSQIDPSDRRGAIGYLPQDNALFHGTLRENLTLDGERRSDEELRFTLDVVGLSGLVNNHPAGLDLPLAGSQSVSGGQRQAIALARLFLQNPRVVLLDEPTAAFDQANERRLIEFMTEWSRGRTLIVATHRRAVLSLTDRVLALSGGRIVGDGPREPQLVGAAPKTVAHG